MRFNYVQTLVAHNSEAAKKAIDGMFDRCPMPYIRQAIVVFSREQRSPSIVVLFPDDGARKRYEIMDIVGNQERIFVKILNCEKKRNPETGMLSGFTVPELPTGIPAIIIDDICDGGGTFSGIGAAVPASTPLALYVTHGIFSKGFDPLKRFDRIYTTDSFEHQTSAPITVLR